jgi:hypothetical protein
MIVLSGDVSVNKTSVQGQKSVCARGTLLQYDFIFLGESL